jgi:hypothetical protein
VIATAVAGHAYEERLQILVDAEPECVVLYLGVGFDLPPFAVFAQAPLFSHDRGSFTGRLASILVGPTCNRNARGQHILPEPLW